MARRKKNPSTGTVLLVTLAAAAGVGGIGYAVHKARAAKAKKKKKKKKVRCDEGFEPKTIEGIEICVPIGEEAPKVGKTKNRPGKYVGSSGYKKWPHQSTWPNEAAFIAQLKQWGYDPGTSLTSSKGKAAITAWQKDWNKIASRSKLKHFATIGVDGRLGDQTIQAFAAAKGFLDAKEITWPEFVKGGVVQEEEEAIGDDDEVMFPSDTSGIPSNCLKKMQDAFEVYMADADVEPDEYVDSMLEYCADTQGAAPSQLPEIEARRKAILGWMAELGELNDQHSISDYAAAII